MPVRHLDFGTMCDKIISTQHPLTSFTRAFNLILWPSLYFILFFYVNVSSEYNPDKFQEKLLEKNYAI